MTAVVGILNKTTVALAADSAATVTGPYGDKVYNHAHKLFNLSAYAPVGIMIYNSSELVGLPWETLIKIYRKKLGSRLFDNLSDYANDFIISLNEYIAEMDEDDAIVQLQIHSLEVWDVLWSDFNVYLENTNKTNEFNKSNEEEKNIKLNNDLKEVIIPACVEAWQSKDKLECLSDYTLEEFKTQFEKDLKDALLGKFVEIDFIINVDVLDAILDLAFLELSHRISIGPWTGLVIAGFGEKELFPSIESYKLGPLVNNKIRILKDGSTKISSSTDATIKPYAQTHDMYSFLTGIDPAIRSTIKSGAAKAFEELIESVVEKADSEDSKRAITELLSGYKEPTLDSLMKSIHQVSQKQHIGPILSSISLSSKEELADMAESLISLTSLKRKFSLSTESVGGPVDVAVITKGEGFIWLKRKQYFRPELNLNYVSGVFNKSPHFSQDIFPSQPNSLNSHEPDSE